MFQFMIFGAGLSGMAALDLLGFERTKCFIDNGKSGEIYCDKAVISLEEFLDGDFKEIIVAIASEKYHKEMLEQLKKSGFDNYFVYHDMDIWYLRDMLPRYYLYRQIENVSYARILSENNINKYKKVCVYGDNKLLHYLLLEIAYQNSFECIYGLVKTLNQEEYTFNIPEVKLENAWDDIDCLIINSKRNEDCIFDILQEQKHKFDIVNIYDVDSYEQRFIHPELKKYKNIHKGKRIWIIGNGPSMRIEDLEVLHDNNEICFGFNKIFRIYDKTNWRADYLGITDCKVIDSCQEISEISKNAVVFVGDEYHRSTNCITDGVQYVHINHEEYYPNYPNFSEDISKQVYWGCTVSYDIGIQFASYMGASEIYLIGVDNMNVGSVSDDRNHFIKGYFSEEEKKVYKNVVTQFNKINKAYEKAQKYSMLKGFRIYNATRGGALEAFERVNFDDMFKGEK